MKKKSLLTIVLLVLCMSALPTILGCKEKPVQWSGNYKGEIEGGSIKSRIELAASASVAMEGFRYHLVIENPRRYDLFKIILVAATVENPKYGTSFIEGSNIFLDDKNPIEVYKVVFLNNLSGETVFTDEAHLRVATKIFNECLRIVLEKKQKEAAEKMAKEINAAEEQLGVKAESNM